MRIWFSPRCFDFSSTPQRAAILAIPPRCCLICARGCYRFNIPLDCRLRNVLGCEFACVCVCVRAWAQTQTHCSLSCSASCRAERSQSVCAPCKLQLEDCLSAELVPTPELIQGYVKKVGKLSKWLGGSPTNSESIGFFTATSNIFWANWAQKAQSGSWGIALLWGVSRVCLKSCSWNPLLSASNSGNDVRRKETKN